MSTVRQFADRILELQGSQWDQVERPLFADGMNVDTLKPFEWQCEDGDNWVLSNLASQQNWLRLLSSLSTLTGDEQYHQRARDTMRYALEHLRYGKLLQWGGHMACDLAGKRTVYAPDKGPQHELKCHYPYYELMNEVDPEEAKAYIEAYWNSHIVDWSNLEFSRHGQPVPDPDQGSVWDREYEGGAPFFTGTGLTFINAGSDLYYAAGMLYGFTGDERALEWAKRLNGRYTDSRNSTTGMGGYQFSISVLPGVRGDRAIAQFGEQLKEHNPLEGTLSVTYQIVAIIGKAALCRMALADRLGEPGREFADTAIEDLLAYARYCYDEADNLIHPVLTDGTRLTGLVMEKSGYYGKQGAALQAAPASPLLLWSYSMGYRVSRNPQLWRTVRGIAKGNGLGDFGEEPGGGSPQANLETKCTDPYAIFALLELYRATGEQAYLDLAEIVGDNIIRTQYQDGFFLPSKSHVYCKLDGIAPLALLHLSAEIRGIRQELPVYCGGSAFFGSAYKDMGHKMDQQFYDLVVRK